MVALADALPIEYRSMVFVGGLLGLRWSEVAGLRVGRIDLARQTVFVFETLSEVNGCLIVSDVKSAASRRTVPMPAFVANEIADHLARTCRTDPQDYVFVGPGGAPLRAGNFRSLVWSPAVAQAGLSGLTFHGLRHSAVGLMIEAGAHIEAIKQRMGHSSIRVTSDTYGSLLPTVDQAVTTALDRLFDLDVQRPTQIRPVA